LRGRSKQQIASGDDKKKGHGKDNGKTFSAKVATARVATA
jgi:hypothetical protein